MKKSMIALALAATFAAPGAVQVAAAEEAASPHSITGNLGLVSSYRFRGIDQTFGKPALQGGVDYAHSSGFYAGNWNSNISSGAGFADGNLEMDFYAGYAKTIGDFGFDVGALYYYYPGTTTRPLSGTNAKKPLKTASGSSNNAELYVSGTWKFLTLKYSHAVTDYFGLPSSKGANYLELNAEYDLGNGWGVSGHLGSFRANKFKYEDSNGKAHSINYSDWSVGVTKDVQGWVFGLSYVDTNAKGSCTKAEFYCFANSFSYDSATGEGVFGSKTKNAGRGVAILSVNKEF